MGRPGNRAAGGRGIGVVRFGRRDNIGQAEIARINFNFAAGRGVRALRHDNAQVLEMRRRRREWLPGSAVISPHGNEHRAGGRARHECQGLSQRNRIGGIERERGSSLDVSPSGTNSIRRSAIAVPSPPLLGRCRVRRGSGGRAVVSTTSQPFSSPSPSRASRAAIAGRRCSSMPVVITRWRVHRSGASGDSRILARRPGQHTEREQTRDAGGPPARADVTVRYRMRWPRRGIMVRRSSSVAGRSVRRSMSVRVPNRVRS